jgi:hypothetical protein
MGCDEREALMQAEKALAELTIERDGYLAIFKVLADIMTPDQWAEARNRIEMGDLGLPG